MTESTQPSNPTGNDVAAMHMGSRRRITCSRACSEAHTRRLQRENTRRYVKGEKYKAYKARYYEAIKARRRLARIRTALASIPAVKAAVT